MTIKQILKEINKQVKSPEIPIKTRAEYINQAMGKLLRVCLICNRQPKDKIEIREVYKTGEKSKIDYRCKGWNIYRNGLFYQHIQRKGVL